MRFLLLEPKNPKYIHVSENNKVHLLVPFMTGNEISTQDPVTAVNRLRRFFQRSALRALNLYKEALIFDITILNRDDPLSLSKQARLAQIEIYIQAVSQMHDSYGIAISTYLKRRTNLYGMQLKPSTEHQHPQLLLKPTFKITSKTNAAHQSESALFIRMQAQYPDVVITDAIEPSRRTSPFYSIPAETPVNECTESLSIMTQVFLANLNIYCKARFISIKNFGIILSQSVALSTMLVEKVIGALNRGLDVENEICSFCHEQSAAFGLSRPLTEEDVESIKQQFMRTYPTVAAAAYKYYFVILDKTAVGDLAKFVTHRGSICINFADLIDPTTASINPAFFSSILADFDGHSPDLPPTNQMTRIIEIQIPAATLQDRLSDEQFRRLPQQLIIACWLELILDKVAKGKEDETIVLLTDAGATFTQELLRTPGQLTDYSGRIFHCTAYEYAYWAMDARMCAALQAQMNPETKLVIWEKICRQQERGLDYQQHGQSYCTPQFNLEPFKKELRSFINFYDAFLGESDWDGLRHMEASLGKRQRNFPAHFAYEYCRTDRAYLEMPSFTEKVLPTSLKFMNFETGSVDSWYPLRDREGLGYHFFLVASCRHKEDGRCCTNGHVDLFKFKHYLRADLAAIEKLETVRQQALRHLLLELNPPTSEYEIASAAQSMRV